MRINKFYCRYFRVNIQMNVSCMWMSGQHSPSMSRKDSTRRQLIKTLMIYVHSLRGNILTIPTNNVYNFQFLYLINNETYIRHTWNLHLLQLIQLSRHQKFGDLNDFELLVDIGLWNSFEWIQTESLLE